MIKPTRFHVVIPCAGSGTRAGMQIPKQYAVLMGLPVVMHTLKVFDAMVDMGHGVVVVAPDDQEMKRLLKLHPQEHFQVFNTGGQTRAESVLSGLKALRDLGIDEDDWVMVHDAARCLVTPELIHQLITATQNDAVGGLLALPLPDTLKSEELGRVSKTLDRAGKWLAQTPQMFRWNLLYKALNQSLEHMTDESSAIEALGMSPLLVKSAAFNFKITYPEDLDMAQAVLIFRQKMKENG